MAPVETRQVCLHSVAHTLLCVRAQRQQAQRNSTCSRAVAGVCRWSWRGVRRAAQISNHHATHMSRACYDCAYISGVGVWMGRRAAVRRWACVRAVCGCGATSCGMPLARAATSCARRCSPFRPRSGRGRERGAACVLQNGACVWCRAAVGEDAHAEEGKRGRRKHDSHNSGAFGGGVVWCWLQRALGVEHWRSGVGLCSR